MPDNRFRLPPFIIHRRLSSQDVAGERLPYNLTAHGFPDLWDFTGAGEGIRIAIGDTGVDQIHREDGDLVDQLLDVVDFTGSRVGTDDPHGHGTHTTGTILAQYRNQHGIAGVAHRAKGYHGKCLADDGYGSDEQIALFIRWAADVGCHLISLSLGGPHPSRTQKDAIEYAYANGVVGIICAAGNEGRAGVGYPGAYIDPPTYATGAVDEQNQIADFSSRGDQVNGVGPGVRIRSTYKNGRFAELSGTSMACPWIAGVVANRLSAELQHAGSIQTDSPEALIALMSRSSIDLGRSGRDPEYGSGLLDANTFCRVGLDDDTPDDDPGGITLGKIRIRALTHDGESGLFLTYGD